MSIIISLINTAVNLLSLLVIIHSLLSFFLTPSHPIRRTIGQIVEPLLAPIRRVIPPISGLDFSPLVLIILLEVLGRLLKSLLR